MNAANFRVSTDILRRLGEELNASFDQGIIELVKNAYDADAFRCTVELIDADTPGGSVIVKDDGIGMTVEDIREGWFVLGRSRKNPKELTLKQRLPAGSKGLGRLGALRLGNEVLLTTRPSANSGIEYSVHISWPEFDNHEIIEDISIDISSRPSMEASGTHIEIRGLKNQVGESEVVKLARELVLLSDPFGDPSGFAPELVAPEFKQLEALVRTQYFDDYELRLEAHLSSQGTVSAKVFDRFGMVRWTSTENEFGEYTHAPEATFEIWVFLVAGPSFEGRTATLRELRRWLQQTGGVHLYHRGLRVRPYGDPGHDWLDMNLARARDPELRPSTNTSVGRMTVLDVNERLLQKTDRMGFVENAAFNELRDFGIGVLDWMQRQRLAVREAQREEEKTETNQRVAEAEAHLSQVIRELPMPARQHISRLTRELAAAKSLEFNQVRDELTLYQTLASVGTTVSVFAHEIEGPATDLTVSAKAIQRRASRALGTKYEGTLGTQVEAVIRSSELLARFATLPLGLLRKSKRRRTVLDVNKVVADALELFGPYLLDAHIEPVYEPSAEAVEVRSSVASIESVLSNLITNSVKAFKREGAHIEDRKLVVRTSVNSERVLLSVLDSGPGIPTTLGESIWLPGITSDENGTGLGLTIVRDTVKEMGGNANVIPNSELGGAEFIIDLPRRIS